MTDWTCWRDASHPVIAHPLFGWPQCTVCGAAPQYHERGAYLPADLQLTLYVPTGDPRMTGRGIAPGSGVVGLTLSDNLVEVCYEGWVHGAMQYSDRDTRGRWEAGVFQAADRLVTAYPTVARAYVAPDQLQAIGTYNPSTGVLTVTREATLDAWLEDA